MSAHRAFGLIEYPCPYRLCDWVVLVHTVMEGRRELVKHCEADHAPESTNQEAVKK